MKKKSRPRKFSIGNIIAVFIKVIPTIVSSIDIIKLSYTINIRYKNICSVILTSQFVILGSY